MTLTSLIMACETRDEVENVCEVEGLDLANCLNYGAQKFTFIQKG